MGNISSDKLSLNALHCGIQWYSVQYVLLCKSIFYICYHDFLMYYHNDKHVGF